VYTVDMAIQATELRKRLFQILEEVSQGASVDVSYKGTALRIVPAEQSSRLGRLVVRDLGVVVKAGNSGWSAAAKAEWEAEGKKFYGRPGRTT